MQSGRFLEVGRAKDQVRRISFAVGSLVLALLFAAGVARAQVTTADIVGTVTDPNGAAVVNGTATATNVGTGEQQKTALSATGTFEFTLLQVGSYKVRVQAAGFRNYETQVTLAAGDRARVTVQLSVGQA